MRRLLLVLLTTVLLLIGGAATAHAEEGDSHEITRYDVVATAAEDGTIDVKVNFDFDFHDEPAHGPYVALAERQRIPGDPKHWRQFDISDVEASSPSGAPADVQTHSENGALMIRVGDPGIEVEGPQTYEVSYTISGIVNPNVATSNLDEINWQIIGGQWEVPISNASIELEGPASIERVACFTRGDEPCQAEQSGRTATFTEDLIKPGDGMQVVAGFPVGTFVGAEPRLTERVGVDTMFEPTPLSLAGGGIVAALGAALGGLVLHRRRDEAFVGVAHGHVPDDADNAQTTKADRRSPITVQFSPPKGLLPGQLGTLTDEKADPRDVTATIVDLAVRGYLKIVPIGEGKGSEWQLVRSPGTPQGLRTYEAQLFNGLFSSGPTPTLAVLRKTGFPQTVSSVQQLLYKEVTDLGWYARNPQSTRARWMGLGIGIIAIGAVLGFLLGSMFGLGLIGVGVGLVGLLIAILGFWAPSRTALGTAALQQALGFKEYIKTAEADQIKFEEGIDVFSRYLPYAIAWNLADRWAKVFQELAQTRGYEADMSWYGGYGFGVGFMSGNNSFMSSIDSFTAATATAMTSESSGSGGGSGFSGGGGVGGGGGGSW
ncbi:DUF2207 domain-containing protein [Propionibacteriaceae bacterium Y1700]|uniref:DUF2207 domain-containing protein n=1 Tax=Microlunatus sp. Y1700 TaxID=3418487 RepID=UPI003DA6D9D4